MLVVLFLAMAIVFSRGCRCSVLASDPWIVHEPDGPAQARSADTPLSQVPRPGSTATKARHARGSNGVAMGRMHPRPHIRRDHDNSALKDLRLRPCPRSLWRARQSGMRNPQRGVRVACQGGVVGPASTAEPLRLTIPRRNMNDPMPSGTAVLRVHVDELGIVRKTSLETSSGNAALDAAAQRTLVGARFVPYREAGKAMAVTTLMPMNVRASSRCQGTRPLDC
ncbi:MAG: TonB family protein [Proteobacteria bacterium]|nr:MAG: TonB family protein [Pseudomonadota bacterium]